MISATAAYTSYSRDLTSTLQRVAAQKTVQTMTKAFEKAFSKVDTLDEFMSNKTVYNYALKAYGLQDTASSKALIRKILEGGTESGSLASRMTDQRFKELARTFTFDDDGNATYGSGIIPTVEAAYYHQTLEEGAGEVNEGARLALYFRSKASSITSVYGLLADKNLLRVVQGALGLPATMSTLSIEKQAAMITKKLDIEDLQDPTKLAKFLSKFTAQYDAENSSASDNPVISLLASLQAGANGSSAGASLIGTLASR